MLPPPLVALSPGDLDEGSVADFVRRIERAFQAGLEGLCLREPRLSDRVLAGLGRELRPHAAWLAVHDRAHLAPGFAADAVHGGFRSLTPSELTWLPAGRAGAVARGRSVHAHDDVTAWRGADYLLAGPVRPTPSKAGLVDPLGIDGLATLIARAAPTPVWAVGGLRPEDVRGVTAAGARGVFVLSGILSADDPAAAARRYVAEVGG